MIRRLFRYGLFASALTVGGLLACNVFPEVVTGSGVPGTEDRAVGAVNEVYLSGVGNLTIEQGDTPALSVTADDNLLPYLETETRGHKLTIRTKSGFEVRSKTPIEYTLAIPNLEKLHLSGAGSAKAEKITGGKLEVHISGAGHATLREVTFQSLSLTLSGAGGATLGGSADKSTLKISGAGDIDASDLKAKAAEVRVSGAGTAKVWALDSLNARVSGAGDIKYRGSPKIEQKVSGAGSVKPIEK
jgi:hypothetical protein